MGCHSFQPTTTRREMLCSNACGFGVGFKGTSNKTMLTQDQINTFQRQGYLVIEDVFDQAKIMNPVRDEYRALFEALCEAWRADAKLPDLSGKTFEDQLVAAYRAGCDWFQPMDISLPGDRVCADTPFHFGPAIFGMVTAPQLLDLVECLIGPEITSNTIQHIRIKPPLWALLGGEVRAHIASTAWHQDRAVALEAADETNMVTVWCAVTDATEENGCLQVIPKAPGQEMLPHCPRRQPAIAPGYLDKSAALPVPVKSGGVVIFDPMTPHSSLENHSDGIRWSFDLRFHVTGQNSGREHFPSLVARSPSDPDSVLGDWREWKAMWEAARARLANVPHTDIHRWSSDSPQCA